MKECLKTVWLCAAVGFLIVAALCALLLFGEYLEGNRPNDVCRRYFGADARWNQHEKNCEHVTQIKEAPDAAQK